MTCVDEFGVSLGSNMVEDKNNRGNDVCNSASTEEVFLSFFWAMIQCSIVICPFASIIGCLLCMGIREQKAAKKKREEE